MGVDKAKRYGWTIPEKPGVFMLISKRQLHIDGDYQRAASKMKILTIAGAFSWPAFGCLVVVLRSDGSFFVIDGQHRKLAADRRDDLDELPCLVFELEGVKAEAAAFVVANEQRRPVSALEKYKAKIVAEDPTIAAVNELVIMSGKRPGKAEGDIYCIALVERLMRRRPEVLRRIWPVILELCGSGSIHEKLVDGLFHLETHLPEGRSITDPKLRERLKKIGATELISSAISMARAYAKGGARVWCEGFLAKLNKGYGDASPGRIVLTANP